MVSTASHHVTLPPFTRCRFAYRFAYTSRLVGLGNITQALRNFCSTGNLTQYWFVFAVSIFTGPLESHIYMQQSLMFFLLSYAPTGAQFSSSLHLTRIRIISHFLTCHLAYRLHAAKLVTLTTHAQLHTHIHVHTVQLINLLTFLRN